MRKMFVYIINCVCAVVTFQNLLYTFPAAPALRTPLSIAAPYGAPFAMMGHHPEMNGSLTSPGVYPGLHISSQMTAAAAAAAAYGRSPMVRFAFCVDVRYCVLSSLDSRMCTFPLPALLIIQHGPGHLHNSCALSMRSVLG